MEWTASVTYGALGGFVVEIVVFYGRIAAWQTARHRALAKNRRRDKLPRLDKYIDPPSDVLAALTRVSLGAGAGWLFAPQLTGALATVAVGASAPALLRQLGSARTLQGVIGGGNSAPGPTDSGNGNPSALTGEAEVLES
ncbi:hypothetical protein ACQEVG_37200 [Streptomyces sp. CA-135486]|uniref:hypothetical protein n=1 Tax=Streptomyces sp. CA-135486 TaxID=3240049 RepID=UPI003D941B3E